MRLNVKAVSQNDFGSYRCVAKNSLGDTDGTIKLYSRFRFNYLLSTNVLRIPNFSEIPRGQMNNIEYHGERKKGN